MFTHARLLPQLLPQQAGTVSLNNNTNSFFFVTNPFTSGTFPLSPKFPCSLRVQSAFVLLPLTRYLALCQLELPIASSPLPYPCFLYSFRSRGLLYQGHYLSSIILSFPPQDCPVRAVLADGVLLWQRGSHGLESPFRDTESPFTFFFIRFH